MPAFLRAGICLASLSAALVAVESAVAQSDPAGVVVPAPAPSAPPVPIPPQPVPPALPPAGMNDALPPGVAPPALPPGAAPAPGYGPGPAYLPGPTPPAVQRRRGTDSDYTIEDEDDDEEERALRGHRKIPSWAPPSATSSVDPKDKTQGETLLEKHYGFKTPTGGGTFSPSTGASWAPGGTMEEGLRVGRPYYWSAGGYPGTNAGRGIATAAAPGTGYAAAPGSYPAPVAGPSVYPAPEYGVPAYSAPAQPGCACQRGAAASGGGAYYGPQASGYAAGPDFGYASPAGNAYGYGYGAGGGGVSGDPYYVHFGPGFHRSADHAHYRYPYYSYRRPWYHPGHPSYNRDTNYPW